MKIIKIPSFSSELKQLEVKSDGQKFYVEKRGKVSAGFPSPAEDFQGEKLSLDERYLDHPESTYFLEVGGLSMYPTLQIGDILIVRRDLNIDDNKIAVISVNNSEFTTKRFDKKSNIFRADNPNFSDIKVSESDTVIDFGVVKQIIREV